jgi:hypothetical protein
MDTLDAGGHEFTIEQVAGICAVPVAVIVNGLLLTIGKARRIVGLV